jgi:tryptophan halogenase
MVIIEIGYLLEGLEALRDGCFDPAFPEGSSRRIGEHWDYLRWFLALHYRFNRRLDTPFWRAARADANVSGVAEILAKFRRNGAWLQADGNRFEIGDPTFGYSGLMTLLLGQAVQGSERTRATMEREAWISLSARHRGVASRALPHRDALDALRADPRMLTRFVESPSSWIRTEHWHRHGSA